MIQKLVDFWYAIPRDKEWWFDQIGKVVSGCFTGCFTFLAFWFASSLIAILFATLFAAKDSSEGLWMGLAWGCPLGLTTAIVGGSLVLSGIARYRGA